jgi:hypothetical protein
VSLAEAIEKLRRAEESLLLYNEHMFVFRPAVPQVQLLRLLQFGNAFLSEQCVCSPDPPRLDSRSACPVMQPRRSARGGAVDAASAVTFADACECR